MKLIYCFFAFAFLVKAKDVPEEMVQYYLKLLEEYATNFTIWEHPTDNRNFFQLINEEAEAKTGRFKVLVLEAGGRENDFTDVPGFAPYVVRSDYNWGYKAIPQKRCCLGFKNKQCNYIRGRGVGGSTVVNYMMYVRGNKEDFDKWGSKNPGWDYESVLHYFKKYQNASLRLEDAIYHGHNGSLSVEDVRLYPEAVKLFRKAAKQRGRDILDYNGEDQYGYSTIQAMTKKGTRCSANKAFVEPTMGRKNLELLDHALVTRILIENKIFVMARNIMQQHRKKSLFQVVR
ncbi:hypothetical protein ILUMI_19719 [Ignelater luminosus]|uniref:Glucose-methanol-choline oxidoreductase N-terminal domain-containing protein n=1 Tax=Ignelater luminosus TaxID=2038154 RepID=A0A8K0FZL8_IGNLU|nr:hypothetical protein ILUMI_19719 [Ignelater luminosus]